MRVFVTGVNGQLGSEVAKELRRQGQSVIGCGTRETGPENVQYVKLDITDKVRTVEAIVHAAPDAVIHCAAWTAVDAAEDEENISKVYAVNEQGTRNVAEACAKINSKMCYISTDYVFSGKGTAPWEPDCQVFEPCNVYGKSKLAGEMAVRELLERYYIVRTAWVFGRNGKNFVNTMLRLGQTQRFIKVVSDQIGTPTYTADLAPLLIELCRSENYGCYHATNEGGYISWYDFCCEIFRQVGLDTYIIPVATSEYVQSKAIRPLNSRLDKSKLVEKGFVCLPDWKNALERYLKSDRK